MKIPYITYLSHLETDNLGEVAGTPWNFSVVHAENTCLVRGDAIGLDALIAEFSLILAECDACDVAVVVFSCIRGQGTPATAYVEETIFRFEIELRADKTEFIILKLFEGGILISVGDDTGGIDHAMAKEPGVLMRGEIQFLEDTYHS